MGSILVTGAAGFAGGHLLDLLCSQPAKHDVIAWHRGATPAADRRRVRWESVELLDRTTVASAIDRIRPSVVYHCAGAAHVGRAWDDATTSLAVNVRGTDNLLNALERVRPSSPARVLIPSSALVYRPAERPLTEDDPLVPAGPYGLSKLAQEMLALQSASSSLEVVVARAFNHTGPEQNPGFAAPAFARQIAAIEAGKLPPTILVGNLDARRDITDVRDVVRAYRTIVERGLPGRAYNVCSGRAIRIGDLLQQLLDRARVQVTIQLDETRLRPSDVPLLVGSATRMQAELGWVAQIPLGKTLDDLLAFWRSREA